MGRRRKDTRWEANRGHNSSAAKLTKKELFEIYDIFYRNMSLMPWHRTKNKEIAEKYGVSPTTVTHIKKGIRYHNTMLEWRKKRKV